MNPLTIEWVDKAERDYCSAKMLLRARKNPNYDGCCFFAQQCAEKYMKAVLQEENIAIKRVHELSNLLKQLIVLDSTWELLKGAAEMLTKYAVDFRYPGNSADKEMAKRAIQACELIRYHMQVHLKYNQPAG